MVIAVLLTLVAGFYGDMNNGALTLSFSFTMAIYGRFSVEVEGLTPVKCPLLSDNVGVKALSSYIALTT